jgi:hypothetical protein
MSSDVIHHRHVLLNSATKLPPIYGTPGVHYRVNNSPPLAHYTPPFSSSMIRSLELYSASFSAVSCCFLCLTVRSQWSPKQPDLTHPQPTSLPYDRKLSVTHELNRWLYSSACMYSQGTDESLQTVSGSRIEPGTSRVQSSCVHPSSTQARRSEGPFNSDKQLVTVWTEGRNLGALDVGWRCLASGFC